MKKYEVVIKGITPLLQHKWLPKKETATKKGEELDSPEKAVEKLYKVGDKIVVPSVWILSAMFKVSSDVQVPGMKRKTYKQLLPGNVFIKPEYIEIEPQKWVVDERSVVIPATRGRIMRYRPRFDKWKLKFEIEVYDDRITPDALQLILTEAGRRVGIGDGRKIGFGRFVIEEFKEI